MAISISPKTTWFDDLRERLWQRANTRPADYVLMIVVGILVLIGVMMIYSVSVGPNLQVGSDDPFSLVERHLGMLVIGLAVMFICARLDYHLLMKYAVPMMLVTVALLVALLLFGQGVNDARRWLIGPSIQPGELAKLVTIIYVAAWSASKGKKLKRLVYGLIPFSILIGFLAGIIILEPNYSTALLIAAVAFTMFFIAGADLKQFLGAAVFGGAVTALVVTQSARAMSRFSTLYMEPTQELTDGSWQVAQTLLALASGGIFGKGLGTGGGQYGYVPLAHSDGIFAIWSEETGLVGAVILVILFVVLAYRGFRIARNAPDDFGRVLAAGITFWLVLQGFLNMAVVTQLIPFTGQPLPFISYGGSSLVMCLAGVGILMSISRALPKPPIVKSVPVVVGAPPKENTAMAKKNATISYGGGTGGHVYPLVAVLQELAAAQQINLTTEVLYIGRVDSVEERIAAALHVPFQGIHVGGVRSLGLGTQARNVSQMANASRVADRIIAPFQPNVVLATGGYVSAPVLWAAWRKKIPSIIELPDLEPGWAIRATWRLSKQVAVSFQEVLKYFSRGHATVTGFPVRSEFFQATHADGQRHFQLDSGFPVVTVFGGSQGAHALNEAVRTNLRELLSVTQIIHICGIKDRALLEAERVGLPRELAARYRVFEYLNEDMPLALAAADVIVARAGAATLGEFPAVGVPSILVPGLFAQGHQAKNAEFLAGRGAAIHLPEEKLVGEFVPTVSGLLKDKPRLIAMAEANRRLAQPGAAKRIGKLVQEYAR